jgi:hypothetical protein
MKQFKIIHKKGFTTEERRVFRDALWKSAIEAMRSLIRSRQDLLDVNYRRDDPDGIQPGMVDASLEPYFQFLLYRIRNDQPLYEEISIAVSADNAARGSPVKTAARPAAASLTTSTTVVLSSPVAEKKLPKIRELDSKMNFPRQNSGLRGSSSDLLSNFELGGSPPENVERAVVPSNDSIPYLPSTTANEPILETKTHEVLEKVPSTTTASETSTETNTTDDAEKLPSPEVNLKSDAGKPKGAKRKLEPLFNQELTPTIEEEGEEDVSEPSAKHQHTPMPTQLPTQLEEESEDLKPEFIPSTRDGSHSKRKHVFATAEEEMQYLAKLERKKKKKKKRDQEKKRMMEAMNMNSAAPLGTIEEGGKSTVVYASSIDSYRSDMVRMSGAQNPANIHWEKLTIGRLLQKIWMDPLIQKVWATEEKSPQLEAPLGYIMDAMDRIADPGFQPTNEDILLARKRTSGVNLLDFEAYRARFLLIDVGGQRTERKKWLAHFDVVDAVIFVVGLDQYDQVMMEDGVTNRLRDSMELFEQMCSSPWFRSSSFLLFLNKSDIFKTKIRQVPLTVCFPNYTGDPHDFEETSQYIIDHFKSIHTHYVNLNRNEMQQNRRGGNTPVSAAIPQVYPYMTCATDTESMRFVIDTCHDILLVTEMAQWGFFDM